MRIVGRRFLRPGGATQRLLPPGPIYGGGAGFIAVGSRPQRPSPFVIVGDAAEWKEGDHPRAKDGKFGSGNGGHEAVLGAVAHHSAEGQRHRTAGGGEHGSAARSHEKAAKHYAFAAEHYGAGREEEGIAAHKEAETHRKDAMAKERRHFGEKKPAEEKKPEEKKPEEKKPEEKKPKPATSEEVNQFAVMKEANYAAKYGIRVNPILSDSKNRPSNEQVGVVRAAYAAIPSSHRDVLKGRCYIRVEDTITLSKPSSTGIVGKGTSLGYHSSPSSITDWPSGKPNAGFIVIAEKAMYGGELRKVNRTNGTVAHEVGHALDYALGNPSRAAEFRFRAHAEDADAAGRTKAEARIGQYYHSNVQETFAECYSVEYASVMQHEYFFGGMTRERAKVVYAKPIAAMKQLIEERRKMIKK